MRIRPSSRLARVKGQALNLARAAGLYARLMRRVEDPELRTRYRREIRRQFQLRRDPGYLFGYLVRCAMHYHHYTLTRHKAREQGQVVNSF